MNNDDLQRGLNNLKNQFGRWRKEGKEAKSRGMTREQYRREKESGIAKYDIVFLIIILAIIAFAILINNIK